MRKHPIRSIGIFGLSLCSFILLSMFVLTPDQLGPLLITGWFILVFVATTALLMSMFLKLSTYLHRGQKRHSYALALRRATLAALFLVSLMALGSLHQLSVVDIVLVTLLVLAVEFYFFRRSGISYE